MHASRRQRLMLQKGMDRQCSYIILYCKLGLKYAYAVWKISHYVIKCKRNATFFGERYLIQYFHTPFKKISIPLSLSVTMHLVYCRSCNKLLIKRGPIYHGNDYDTVTKYEHWWPHDKEKLSLLLALCMGNLPVSGGFPKSIASIADHCRFFD